jgi:hypothetical protein
MRQVKDCGEVGRSLYGYDPDGYRDLTPVEKRLLDWCAKQIEEALN